MYCKKNKLKAPIRFTTRLFVPQLRQTSPSVSLLARNKAVGAEWYCDKMEVGEVLRLHNIEEEVKVILYECEKSWNETLNFDANVLKLARHILFSKTKHFILKSLPLSGNISFCSINLMTREEYEQWHHLYEKHFSCYFRWQNILELQPTEDHGTSHYNKEDKLKRTVEALYLYHIIYIQLNDLRGLKNLLNLLFHVAYTKLQSVNETLF